MGFGRGIGYYNIAPMDSHIHRLSAKGVKTYQKGSMPIQNTASIKATAMVGDGKTPNKYFVTIGEDYYYYDEETGSYNWVSDKYSGYDFKGKTMKVFDTYEEAKEYADSLALNSLVDGVKVKCVQIEDRLTGQVYERTQKEEGGVLESSDIKFTKDTEAKKGVKSTIAKTRPKENPVNSKNLVNYIMEFEGGNPTSEDTMHLFSYLIKTGQAWTLQGMYGRTARDMIESGFIDKKGNINWANVEATTLSAKRFRDIGQKRMSKKRYLELGIDKEMESKFTPEQLRVLRNMNLQKQGSVWSLKRTKQPNELFVLETQLGISHGEAKKLAVKFLDTLEEYPESIDLHYLGYEGQLNALSIDQAKKLQFHDVVTTPAYKNADGTPQRWRVMGKVKTWKKDPNRIRVPIKRGLYDHYEITQDNLDMFDKGE